MPKKILEAAAALELGLELEVTMVPVDVKQST
jgi:hypothetical protein